MKKLNDVITACPPSGIRRFFDIAAEMDDVISLGVGEPDFVTPWRIREAGIYALEHGYTTYTSNAGLPQLRKLICADLASRYGAQYAWDSECLITTGVSEGLDLALRVLFESPTVAGLALAIEAATRAGALATPPIVPVPRTEDLPLSFAQQRLWFLSRLEPESAAYNIPVAVRLTGVLDRAALAGALGVAAERVTEPDELAEKLGRSLASADGPRLFDVPIERSLAGPG